MSKFANYITVFEHQTIKLNQEIDGVKFDSRKLEAFERYYGERGVPYYSLVNKGVRFNEYVGVIQIGETIIEVLPKADNRFTGLNEKKLWRDVLINMLITVGVFDIHAPSSSSLKLKSNSILDLYFKIFIEEVEYLLHNGLIKQYRKEEGNVTALKGSLLFGKHIQQNLTHQERFYVRHSTYDVQHKFHFILYKTICLLKQINTSKDLHSRIGALLLHFPEMPDIKITASTFEKIVFTRKNQRYKKALDISRLLLLQYHPDVRKGSDHVLALMFDMNKLWEQFVFVSLRKNKLALDSITAQTSKFFWKPENGYRSKIRPDIVINKNTDKCVVLDTKWKNLSGFNPSPDDLRQMFVYHEYYTAKRVALIYPGVETKLTKGKYLSPSSGNIEMPKECSLISFAVKTNMKDWQNEICLTINKWIMQPLNEN